MPLKNNNEFEVVVEFSKEIPTGTDKIISPNSNPGPAITSAII